MWAALLGTVLAGLLLGPSSALAAPQVSIAQPVPNSFTDHTTPSFSGSTNEGFALIEVRVYAGSHAEGSVVSETAVLPTPPTWAATSTAVLGQGRYTVQAEEINMARETARSAAVTFVIDTTPPAVSINPASTPTRNATPQLAGAGGVAEGDAKTVSVAIFQGTSVTGTVAAHGSATITSGQWTYTAPHLADGVYTAQTTQVDEAGNVGLSSATIFTIDTTPPALTTSSPSVGAVLGTSAATLKGSAGQASGDQPYVAVKVYSGASTTGTPVEHLQLTAAEWDAGFALAPLPDGQYTLLAEQSDLAGNVARSTVTFRLHAPPPPVTIGLPAAVSLPAQLATSPTPAFAGTAGSAVEDGTAVVVRIYAGSAASGSAVQTLTGEAANGRWTATDASPLPEGTYTAVAEQLDGAYFETGGLSPAVSFQVHAQAPTPTITAPTAGATVTGSAASVAGTAGDAEGDGSSVTVQIFAGTGDLGTPLETITLPASAGGWTTTLGGLAPGVYTVLVQQLDDVGNLGTSTPLTFTVQAPAASSVLAATSASAPVASFEWFPRAPHVAEPISIVSTSTDLAGAITSYGWSLAPSTALGSGQTLHTAFAAAGQYHVRLRIADVLGRVEQAESVIQVLPAVVPLIEPFPVVRVVSTDTAASIRMQLLSVLAPLGSTVTVLCHGAACPARTRTFTAGARDGGTGLSLVRLNAYQRAWRPGAVLQIEVYKPGEIGKYTRIEVRRGQLPRRVDSCLSATSHLPVACPY